METQLENSFDIKKENNKFWLNRWDNDDFPWQQDEFNPKLLSFWNQLSLTEGSQVLVPLCGKSKDMLWLKSKGHKVLGVELSLKAIESFSEENNLKFNQSEQNNFQVFDSKNLSIFQGDIFKLSEKNLEKVEAVFDRGCYIALSEKNRKQDLLIK